MTTAPEATDLPGRASVGRVLKDQRKIELVALGLMIFSLWFAQGDRWGLAIAIASGIFLGLLNHLVTEYWLLKIITTDAKPSRGEMTRSTIVRLAILAVVAIGAAALMWPDGLGLLFGLAVFRLLALAMTSIPLLKELKNQ